MDAGSNIKPKVVWDIKPGALVKIRTYNYHGTAEYKYGIVISEKQIDQIEMFPFVRVFNFHSKIVTKQLPESIEVISRPRND